MAYLNVKGALKMKSKPNRRQLKNFFISKDTQRPLVVSHIAYLLLVAVAIIATVLSPFYYDIFKTNDLWVKHFSAKMFIVLIERLSITSLFILIGSFFHFILLTHKFCGPLVNIGKTIRRISAKDFTRMVYLRKGDFLKNEANQVNTMMEELSISIETIKRENLLLLEDLEGSIKEYGKHEEFNAKLKGFKTRAHCCRMQLDSFQLISDNANKTGTDQFPQVVRDNPVLADKVL